MGEQLRLRDESLDVDVVWLRAEQGRIPSLTDRHDDVDVLIAQALEYGPEDLGRLVEDRAHRDVDRRPCGQVRHPTREARDLTGIEAHRPEALDVGNDRDLWLLDPGWADVEVELAVGPADPGVRDAETVGDRCQDLDGHLAHDGRPQDPETVLDMSDTGRFGRDGAGQFRGLMDHQVGAPCRDQRLEVPQHRWRANPREEAGELERQAVLRRSLGPGRCCRDEPSEGIRVVEPSRMRLEPSIADIAAERWIGRDGDLMSRRLERPRERNHRMEMAVTDHAGEKDPHLGDASSGSLSFGPIATPVRRQSA